jgi:predicted TIM-barrel fold metal-dependent hydrolase
MTRPDRLARAGLAGRPLDGFPVVDVHSHFGKWDIFHAVDLEAYLDEMDRLGIRVMALSSLLALSGDVRRGNDQVARALKRRPDRFFGYVHVNANYPELMLPELKRGFARPGFRGIKVYQFGVPYDDPRFTPVWEFAAARQAPVLAHTWGGNLTGLDRAAAAHPTVPFLAAHAGSDLAYGAYIDAAKRAPNLYLDLTLSRDYCGLIAHFVAAIGAERIVWGTDAPLFSMAHQVGKVLFAQIPEASKRQILGGNAMRLFRLDLR